MTRAQLTGGIVCALLISHPVLTWLILDANPFRGTAEAARRDEMVLAVATTAVSAFFAGFGAVRLLAGRRVGPWGTGAALLVAGVVPALSWAAVEAAIRGRCVGLDMPLLSFPALAELNHELLFVVSRLVYSFEISAFILFALSPVIALLLFPLLLNLLVLFGTPASSLIVLIIGARRIAAALGQVGGSTVAGQRRLWARDAWSGLAWLVLAPFVAHAPYLIGHIPTARITLAYLLTAAVAVGIVQHHGPSRHLAAALSLAAIGLGGLHAPDSDACGVLTAVVGAALLVFLFLASHRPASRERSIAAFLAGGQLIVCLATLLEYSAVGELLRQRHFFSPVVRAGRMLAPPALLIALLLTLAVSYGLARRYSWGWTGSMAVHVLNTFLMGLILAWSAYEAIRRPYLLHAERWILDHKITPAGAIIPAAGVLVVAHIGAVWLLQRTAPLFGRRV